jgi:hypothetical protein
MHEELFSWLHTSVLMQMEMRSQVVRNEADRYGCIQVFGHWYEFACR